MHSSTLAVALFASVSLAQLGTLPTCAQGCAQQQFSGGAYAGCGATDPKCICENDSFLSNIACCLVGACNEADQSSAISFATQICQANGVTVPTAVSCATASASATATATATGATATSSGATTTGTTSASSSAAGTAGATSGSTAGAWAPRQTAAVGLEMLGLAAAGAGLAFL